MGRTKNPFKETFAQRRRQGIDILTIDRAPGETCDICDSPWKGNKEPHCDHDHDTGEFRGWLCFRCNRSIADFERDRLLYQKYQHYLKHGGKYQRTTRSLTIEEFENIHGKDTYPHRAGNPHYAYRRTIKSDAKVGLQLP